MTDTFRIGLIGPDQTQPCGIADYTARLAQALNRQASVIFISFQKLEQLSKLEIEALDSCQAILVQYERSLAPDIHFLEKLSEKYPGRVFVVPHEVYDQDPFAFPYAALKSPFPPLLWLKRALYRWRHRAYAEEKSLQKKAYAASGVFPLSEPGAEILRFGLFPEKILRPVPLAYYIPEVRTPVVPGAPGVPGTAIPKYADFFPDANRHSMVNGQNAKPQKVLGIFGFLNPGLDYTMALDLLEKLDENVALLILGGFRTEPKGDFDPEAEAQKRNLSHRVKVTGYIQEEKLSGHLALCDIFICPLRFKSNSSSLLNLIHLKKPILASDLPLTRYLLAEGAPLQLYKDFQDLEVKVKQALDGRLMGLENHYPWTFDRVAAAYIEAVKSCLAGESSKIK